MTDANYRDFAELHRIVRSETEWATNRLMVSHDRIDRLRDALQATIRYLVANGPCDDAPDDGENSHLG
jgi:hypothetical protein